MVPPGFWLRVTVIEGGDPPYLPPLSGSFNRHASVTARAVRPAFCKTPVISAV